LTDSAALKVEKAIVEILWWSREYT